LADSASIENGVSQTWPNSAKLASVEIWSS